ncbi:MAG: ribosomal RNA small subunit methyltransferase A [Chloroflexi bacterium]|nr:ribosomal RNA small subunit methyltransferase A [Chloroflexota bacterium]
MSKRPPSGAGGHAAKKRFGQHFLRDSGVLRRIAEAAELTAGETVLEVGPGRGALTRELASQGARVVAVEIDRDLTAGLRRDFSSDARVTIVEGDMLAMSPQEALQRAGTAAPYAVVANLPYNVAAPILRGFLEADVPPTRLVVMVQLEVARSIVSRPPQMTLLGVATQVYAEASMVMTVPPSAFEPPPQVQSGVVRIDVLPRPRVDVPIEGFFRVVRAGFGNPRKQLRNSLSFGLHVKQDIVDDLMHTAGVDATLRPQALSIDDWAAVTAAWSRRAAI